MKNSSDLLQNGFTLLDEIFKNKARQTIVGIILAGIGVTTGCVGAAILAYKPNEDAEEKQIEEKDETQE